MATVTVRHAAVNISFVPFSMGLGGTSRALYLASLFGIDYLQVVGVLGVDVNVTNADKVVSLEWPWYSATILSVIRKQAKRRGLMFGDPQSFETGKYHIDHASRVFNIPRIGHSVSDDLELLETSAQQGMRPKDFFESQKFIVPDSYGKLRVPTVMREGDQLFEPLCRHEEDALSFLEALLYGGKCSGIFHLQPWRANKEDILLLGPEVVARRMNQLNEYLQEGDSSDYLYSWVSLIARWVKDKDVDRVTFVHELEPTKLRYLRAIVSRTNKIFERTGLRVISE